MSRSEPYEEVGACADVLLSHLFHHLLRCGDRPKGRLQPAVGRARPLGVSSRREWWVAHARRWRGRRCGTW
eukprot:11079391-Alexandrium_andersonii.AAC.1